MNTVSEYIKRAAKRTGFKREFFIEKNMPTEPSNVYALPFFGNIRSTFILSSLLLKNFKEANPEKYLILCCWPGMQQLFPYVDEYWTIDDESLIKCLATNANNLYNDSSTCTEITKSLSEVLNIITTKDLSQYYDKGFTKKYWDDFGDIKRFLPDVPSVNIIKDFNVQLENREGIKIIIYPATRMSSWQKGTTEQLPVQKEFWTALINQLIKNGYIPVIYQNWFTYDMSKEFEDRCLYLVPKNISELMSALREIGILIDIHTGISRLAIAARCPYLAATERQIYIGEKDYEIDDLCAENLPKQYIFSFSTQLMVGTPEEWEISILGNIITRLKEFETQIKKENLPSTSGSYDSVSYINVRKRKLKRLGSYFIRSSKNK